MCINILLFFVFDASSDKSHEIKTTSPSLVKLSILYCIMGEPAELVLMHVSSTRTMGSIF
jgi:hypothetical protein